MFVVLSHQWRFASLLFAHVPELLDQNFGHSHVIFVDNVLLDSLKSLDNNLLNLASCMSIKALFLLFLRRVDAVVCKVNFSSLTASSFGLVVVIVVKEVLLALGLYLLHELLAFELDRDLSVSLRTPDDQIIKHFFFVFDFRSIAGEQLLGGQRTQTFL